MVLKLTNLFNSGKDCTLGKAKKAYESKWTFCVMVHLSSAPKHNNIFCLCHDIVIIELRPLWSNPGIIKNIEMLWIVMGTYIQYEMGWVYEEPHQGRLGT